MIAVMFRGAACLAIAAGTPVEGVESTQLMQSTLVSVDAEGNLHGETDGKEEFLPCKIWYYSQSNCMFNLGSTNGDMKQYGNRMKSFRMTRSSGSAGDACKVESYSGTGFTGTKTVYPVDKCVKTTNGYGSSKSYKLLGNAPPPPCQPGNMHSYWVKQFKGAGVPQSDMNKICYGKAQWYYNGVSTKVGQGGYNVNCDKTKLTCAGGRGKYGYGSQQARAVKVAIGNGGVHPNAPSLVQVQADIEDELIVAEENEGWRLYEAVESAMMESAMKKLDMQQLKAEIKAEMKAELLQSAMKKLDRQQLKAEVKAEMKAELLQSRP